MLRACLLIATRSVLTPALALVATACALAADPTVVRIEAIGTAFRATLSDGSVRQGRELTGAVLVFDVAGRRLRIRIAAITPDPIDKTGSVLLHDFRLADTDAPLCSPDPDGRQLGFPLAGRSAADGRFVEAGPETFELICTSGGQGKCVRLGYRPWEARDGRPLRDHYNACVRMLRADYCGDGRSWTRDGTLIDMWDQHGIQTSDTHNDPAFSFEAGWSPDGAVCVRRTRIPEALTLDTLKDICPRVVTTQVCDETSARAKGALLFNRSR